MDIREFLRSHKFLHASMLDDERYEILGKVSYNGQLMQVAFQVTGTDFELQGQLTKKWEGWGPAAPADYEDKFDEFIC